MKKRKINYSNGLDLSIWMMKMEILIHELLHMFEKLVLMLTVFYLKKFIVKVLVKTQRDSFQLSVTSRPSFDLSAEHSSRPSFAGTSTTGYDGSRGEGTNDGSDTGNDGGDIANRQISQYPLSPFTGEDDFTHATQDETTGLGELVQVLEPLESHIEVDNEGWHITMRINCGLVLSL